MASSPEKKRLRVETIAHVLNLDAAARAEQERLLIARVSALASYRKAGTVLLYVRAFPEEIDTGPLLADALGSDKRLACPRVDRRAGGLILHEIRDPVRDLRAGMLNIPEPSPDAPVIEPGKVDWVLAPGVAFDVLGNRLGRGAGHYDRLLPRLRKDVEVWAAAFDRQIVDDLPVEPHDVPLDGIVTPTRILIRDQSAASHEASGGTA
ncbi:5-formyltetrahydrofolate cyclo-ligase [Paludisphaera mucosa]|uniref:5-formyltetrahydrofolate cyclo-ligase n=1 Tax=Paludisphaera mucosa TaxID=3030827 RepID=A0ABT6FGS0_9BACT|nr:5-formyltetrahydrofolate cyclo-ligase [Paludisphaera mucosa]MDG3006580.1 5-formyltetrahydrofolate cyclo-ligase [Paludisphaera mucosa]